MFKTSVFGLGTCFGLAACGVLQQASDTRIVGGVPATSVDAVTFSTVSLTLTSGGSVTVEPTSFCSGVMIAPGRVATAASCFKEDIESLRARGAVLNIVFGVNGTLLTLSRVATTVVKHPKFKPELITAQNPTEPANDIAIVNFEGEVPAGHGVATVAAFDFAVPVNESDVFIIAGYGVAAANSETTGVLRQGSVKFASVIDLANVIQFRGTNVSACNGDSGGPTYKMQNGVMTVVGVVSSSNCRSFMRSTDLRRYNDFLKQSF